MPRCHRWQELTSAGILAMIVCLPKPAHASMPMLTESPKPAQPSECHSWAAKQSQDAFEKWGIEDSGSITRGVAIDRLTFYCMGGKTPDIVGFGSSVEFNEAYCGKYRDTAICKNFLAATAQVADAAQPHIPASDLKRPAIECTKFDESQSVTLGGYVVEYEMDEETLVPHTTMGLRLDKPVCFAKDLDNPIDFLDVGNVDRKIVGRHVKVQGIMEAGDSWGIDVKAVSPDPLSEQVGVVWENVSYDQYMNRKSLSVAQVNYDVKSIDLMQTYLRISSATMFGKSEIDRVTFDCARSRFQSLKTTWYEDQMGTGKVTRTLGPGPWGPIPPYAIHAFARVCAP